jgi:superfamily I DNA and/or RNA helicase
MEHNVQSSIKRLRRKLEEFEREIQQRKVDKANVIFCTLSSAGSSLSIIMRTKTVESLIIDEGAAAYEPETYIPIASKRPKSIMIVGDPKQLPATIMSPFAKSRGLAKSLQERLMFDAKQPYTMLKIQYRMRPEISCFPSTVFYNGGIANAASVMASSDEEAIYRNLVHDQPYCFVQVDGTEERQPSGSFHNQKEAEQVVAVVEGARRCIRRASLARSNQYHFKNMRVITIYQAQVDLLSRLLRAARLGDVTVSTVDSSQGCEANLVIISFVRTGRQTIGFLSDQRRLNVALTRAKHKLVCIGNIENGLDKVATKGAETVRKLAEDVTSRHLLSARMIRRKRDPRRPKLVSAPSVESFNLKGSSVSGAFN